MKILGLDTTTKYLCLGLSDGSKIYGYSLELGTKHSTLLVPTIKRALSALGWELKDIDYFACGIGPGSFTGMRVGVATVKGLSWAADKPIIGISTLDILAEGVEDELRQIITVLDARRNLLYCSAYQRKNGALNRIKPYLLINEEDLLKIAKTNCIILGDALNLYKDNFSRVIPSVKFMEKDYWHPKPHNIIKLAIERIKDKKLSDAFRLEPMYLYPKECQIKL